jgi:hypothetical protein
MARYLTQSNINAEAGIDIKELTAALKAFDIFESRVRREGIFSATRAAMTPYVVDAKQAAISELTTLNSRARRQMANSIGIKSDNIGKRGKAIAWAIVGPVMGRELTRPRKRRAGSNGQFDYAKMAGWFGGKNGVKSHVTGSKGGKHPGIKATPVWEKLFIANTRQIISRFNNNLTKELQDAVKEAYNKTQKRQARQQKAFQKAIGGGGG